MAEQHDLQALVDIMTCPVCLGTFTNPVTLKCGHVYCRQCIEQTKGVECPQCMRPFTAEDFLTVYPTKELCEYLQNRLSQDMGSSKAITSSATSSRTVLTSSSGDTGFGEDDEPAQMKESVAATYASLENFCPIHEGEETKFVCTSCLQGLCAYCLYEKRHEGRHHKLENLKDLLPQKRKDITELSMIASNLTDLLVKKSTYIHQQLTKIRKEMKKHIEEFRDKILLLIGEYENKLLASLSEFDPDKMTADLLSCSGESKLGTKLKTASDDTSTFHFCINNLKLEGKLRSLVSSLNARIENTDLISIQKGICLHNDWIVEEMESKFRTAGQSLKSFVPKCFLKISTMEPKDATLKKVRVFDNKGRGYHVQQSDVMAIDNRLLVVKETSGRHVRLASISLSSGSETPVSLQHSQEEGPISLCGVKHSSEYLLSVCRNGVLDEFIWNPTIRATLTAYRRLPNVATACYSAVGQLLIMTSDLGHPRLQQQMKHQLRCGHICTLPQVSLFYRGLRFNPKDSSIVIAPLFWNSLTVVSNNSKTSLLCMKQFATICCVDVSKKGQLWVLGRPLHSNTEESLLLLVDSEGEEVNRWTEGELGLSGVPLYLTLHDDQLILALGSPRAAKNNFNIKFVVFEGALSF